MTFSGLKKAATTIVNRLVKEALDRVLKKDKGEKKDSPGKTPQKKTTPPSSTSELTPSKTHPWRLCPIGQHWVREHPLTIPPSEKKPEYETLRRGHCRTSPKGKEVYTTDELREIARLYFETLRDDLEVMPIQDALGYPNENRYDLLIAGWTKFWNETLNPSRPVTPDFIKVLIATETSFRDLPDTPSKAGAARGPIQITESTRRILQDENGELKNHLIRITIEETRDPEVNISVGIRWLYHKRKLLETRIKRDATWEEAAAEYKGIFGDIGKNPTTDRIMNDLYHYHDRIKERRKQREPAL
jgi:hypothetical protein